MSAENYLYFAISIGFGSLGIWVAHRLWTHYGAPHLKFLFYFVTAYNLNNFLNWIGYKYFYSLFFKVDAEVFQKIYWSIGLLYFPTIVLSAGLALAIFWRLLGLRPLKTAGRIGAVALTAWVLVQSVLNLSRLTRGEYGLLESSWTAIDSWGCLYFVFLPSASLLANLFLPEREKRRLHFAFIATFLLLMTLIYYLPLSWVLFEWRGFRVDLLTPLFFASPLLLLLVAHLHQKRMIRLFPPPSASSPDLKALCARFGVSPRECEVLEMVIAGKSHRDIEAALFISVKTVKSHLYSSYRKLGVKNRVQLLNLCQNLRQATPK